MVRQPRSIDSWEKQGLRALRHCDTSRGSRKSALTLLNSPPVCRNLFGPHLHIGAPVAQLDRAFGYEPKGRKFDSCRAHHLFLSEKKLVASFLSRGFCSWSCTFVAQSSAGRPVLHRL